MYDLYIMDYTCPRCMYNTKIRCNMIKHINKSRICKVVKLNIKLNDYKDIILYNKYSVEHIESLLKVDELSNKVKELEKSVGINQSNVVNGNNNTTNNINIVINSYDEPNLEYINERHYRVFMKDMSTAYLNMYREIYFNNDHPENASLKKTNKKDKFIKFYKDGKWNIGNLDSIIPVVKEIVYEALDKGSKDDRLNELVYKLENNKNFNLKVNRDIIASSLD